MQKKKTIGFTPLRFDQKAEVNVMNTVSAIGKAVMLPPITQLKKHGKLPSLSNNRAGAETMMKPLSSVMLMPGNQNLQSPKDDD